MIQRSRSDFILDKDQLDRCVEKIFNGGYQWRQEGITTAFLHLMMGEVHLGSHDSVYVYLAPNMEMARLAMNKFVHLVKQEIGLTIDLCANVAIRIDNGQIFHFVGIPQLLRRQLWRGIPENKLRVFNDIPPDFRYTNEYYDVAYSLAASGVEVIGGFR